MENGERQFPGPTTHLLMPSKEASLQTLPLSVLTPRWGEKGSVRSQMGHTGLHGIPTACTGGLASSSQAQTQGRTIATTPPGKAIPPSVSGNARLGPNTRAGPPFCCILKGRDQVILCQSMLQTPGQLLRRGRGVGLGKKSWAGPLPPPTGSPRLAPSHAHALPPAYPEGFCQISPSRDAVFHLPPFPHCKETPGGTWTQAKTKKKDKDLEKSVPSPEREGTHFFPRNFGSASNGLPPPKNTRDCL